MTALRYVTHHIINRLISFCILPMLVPERKLGFFIESEPDHLRMR